MRYSVPGLGRRLRHARNETGLSQEAVGDRIGVSWMSLYRWERSERGIRDDLLDQLCQLYGKPIHWFLTMEDGDIEAPSDLAIGSASESPDSSDAALEAYRKILEAPATHRTKIENVLEELLDSLMRLG